MSTEEIFRDVGGPSYEEMLEADPELRARIDKHRERIAKRPTAAEVIFAPQPETGRPDREGGGAVSPEKDHVRAYAEIVEMESGSFRYWYHVHRQLRGRSSQADREVADSKAQILVDMFPDLPHATEFEKGVDAGRLSALRWVLGWDRDESMDI